MNLRKNIASYLTMLLFAGVVEAKPATIRGINWFGFETGFSSLMCTWDQPIEWHVDRMAEVNVNHVRLPFSLEFVQRGDFRNMDTFFEKSRNKGIKVLLDFHRLNSNAQSYRPMDDRYSFGDFLQGWETILNRYKDYDNLDSVDIFNEYQGSSFDEWNHLAAETVKFIESKFPNRFRYNVGGVNWGNDISGMNLDYLNLGDRLTYTFHKYHFSSGGWSPDAWRRNWDASIRYPVMVGEWGYKSDRGDEVQYANEFVSYLIEKDIRDSYFWTWSPNSGDTGGLLLDDCRTVDQNKMNLLNRLWFEEPKRYLRK